MWSEDDGAFEGRHYRLAETVCVPAPIQPGGPPIVIGGSGERKTLRLVAQYGDACNLFGVDPEEMKHKIEVLDGNCADLVGTRRRYGAPPWPGATRWRTSTPFCARWRRTPGWGSTGSG